MSDRFIDRLKELDKERTQGDWEVIQVESCYDFLDAIHTVRVKDIHSKFSEIICDNEPYYPEGVSEENQRFIAEAPRMARLLILIHDLCKVVEQESEDDPTDLAKLILRILEKE
jgi:hypothetical protein